MRNHMGENENFPQKSFTNCRQTNNHYTLQKKKYVIFFTFRHCLSLSLVVQVVFRLGLFALSQPDISFSGVIDI